MKLKCIKIVFLALISLSVFLNSCQWINVEPVVVDVPENISFATDIQPIFTDNCAFCHASQAPILTAGNAYNSLINGGYINTENPEASGLIVKLFDEAHFNLNPTQKALLLGWIEQGALNN